MGGLVLVGLVPFQSLAFSEPPACVDEVEDVEINFPVWGIDDKVSLALGEVPVRGRPDTAWLRLSTNIEANRVLYIGFDDTNVPWFGYHYTGLDNISPFGAGPGGLSRPFNCEERPEVCGSYLLELATEITRLHRKLVKYGKESGTDVSASLATLECARECAVRVTDTFLHVTLSP